jgi:hypothetical protein
MPPGRNITTRMNSTPSRNSGSDSGDAQHIGKAGDDIGSGHDRERWSSSV